MLEPPTGWQFVLERPGQRAVVTEVGAALRSWRAAGEERLDGFPVDAAGEPGRVQDRVGLLPWVNWRPVRRTAERVALAYVLHPQPGFEFTVGVEVEYALEPDGLAASLRAVNLGDAPAPFGVAFRPPVPADGFDEPVRGADGRSRVRAGDLLVWTDFVGVHASPLVLEADVELAVEETFAARWGMCVVGAGSANSLLGREAVGLGSAGRDE